jgi:long-chain fatty acid transport protein
MSRIAALTLVAAIVAGLTCKSAYADGITLDGVSAVSIGRGGTNLGYADNGSMLHDNPGAMGQMCGFEMFQLGGSFLFTQFDYGDPDNTLSRSQNQVYPLPEISYIRKLSDEFAVGGGIFTPTGFGAINNLEGPTPYSGTRKYESFGSLTKILLGASYTPRNYDFFSIGATLGPALSFVNLEGPYTLQGPTAPGLPTLLDLGIDGTGISWSVGASAQITDYTSVGLSYLGEVSMDAEGEVGLQSPLGPTHYHGEAKIKWPASLGGGFRTQLTDRVVVATDVVWYNWSDSFDHIELRLSDPSGAGYPPVAIERFPLGWRDTLSTRVGLEYLLENGHTARAGYVHHKSPIPSSTITPWIPGALEHAFSVGYGFGWRDWGVNLAYMFSFGPTVNEDNSDFLGGDFDDSVHRNRSHAVSFSLTHTFGGCPAPGQGFSR